LDFLFSGACEQDENKRFRPAFNATFKSIECREKMPDAFFRNRCRLWQPDELDANRARRPSPATPSKIKNPITQWLDFLFSGACEQDENKRFRPAFNATFKSIECREKMPDAFFRNRCRLWQPDELDANRARRPSPATPSKFYFKSNITLLVW
jgi:hypothetical protein